MKKKKVAILFGGKSGEHEVSIMSARSVAAAIDKKKYDVVPIHITKDGRWLSPAASHKVLGTNYEELIHAGAEEKLKVQERSVSALALRNRFAFDFQSEKIEIVFPVLHGPYGEDGTVQGLLEMLNVAYVGCGVLASSLAMDKAMAKVHFEHAGLNVGKYFSVMRGEVESHLKKIIATAERDLKYPVFIKPANLGSSVGISKAHNRSELTRGLNFAAQFDRKILLEAFIDAREIEVAVLGNEDVAASVAGEVEPCNEFYDYEAKYVKGDSRLTIPAALPRKVIAQIRKAAVAAYTALNCEGMARVDFFLERRTGKIFINEINTIPGFTSISMYPKMFAAAGVSYPSLISRLIDLALARHHDRRRNKVS
ncbi:MAG: D-alanine--D-alanine ligase [Rhizobacter sp.]|nr:D-alanine--D-alanine ligase [Chlorobiales bacterium]